MAHTARRRPAGNRDAAECTGQLDATGLRNNTLNSRQQALDLHALAKELNRPVSTLYVLTPQNDPFHWTPAKIRDAEWFAELWRRFGRKGLHPHGLHYVLISQDGKINLPTGEPYENTEDCDMRLAAAARDARYLRLIEADDIVDRRNEEARIYHPDDQEQRAGMVYIGGGGMPEFSVSVPTDQSEVETSCPNWPYIAVAKPTIPQRYMIELWIEKSTMDDVLDPLAQHHGGNLVSGTGQTSETRCRELVARARAAGLPLRVLYISDFDPSGDSMPVGAARKMEFWIRSIAPDLDVQVRPVALTKQQCADYTLPRTPIKDKERRKKAWEQRHGDGATELDALEALHPGELRRILVEEIERYQDPTLERRIDRKAAEVRAEVADINSEVFAAHEEEIDELRAEHDGLVDEVEGKHSELIENFEQQLEDLENEYAGQFQELGERMKVVWDAVADSLKGKGPKSSEVEWPEPVVDEDPDPLFDSTRDYVEQCNRFKQHQGKLTTRKPGSGWKAGKTRGPMSAAERMRRSRAARARLKSEAAE